MNTYYLQLLKVKYCSILYTAGSTKLPCGAPVLVVPGTRVLISQKSFSMKHHKNPAMLTLKTLLKCTAHYAG